MDEWEIKVVLKWVIKSGKTQTTEWIWIFNVKKSSETRFYVKSGYYFSKSWWVNLTTACKNNIFLKSFLKSATYIHTHTYVYTMYTHTKLQHTHISAPLVTTTKTQSVCLGIDIDISSTMTLKTDEYWRWQWLKPDWKKGLSFFFTISLLLLPTIHSMHVMQ